MIITEARLVKPARWDARGPRMQDNHLLRRCLALFPFWEGGGASAIELMRWAGAAYYARGESSINWSVGPGGIAVENDATDAAGLNIVGSFTQLSKLKPQLPLSIEVVIQPDSPPASGGTIFCNNASRGAAYRGLHLRHTAAGLIAVEICDGGGSSSADRLTWASSDTVTPGSMYHILATVRGSGAGGASMWINGRPQTLALTGTGSATIAYNTDPANILGQGRASTDGFDGRLYFLALYGRVFTDREVHLRARDPYALIRRPLTTARYASFVPPPGGDSGKGSVVCMIG